MRLPWFLWPSSHGRVLGVSWKAEAREQAAFPVPLRTGLSPSRGPAQAAAHLVSAPGHCLGLGGGGGGVGGCLLLTVRPSPAGERGLGQLISAPGGLGSAQQGECPSQGPCPRGSPGSEPPGDPEGAALACPLCWEGAGAAGGGGESLGMPWGGRPGVLPWAGHPGGLLSRGCPPSAAPREGGGASAFLRPEVGLAHPPPWVQLGRAGARWCGAPIGASPPLAP